MTSPRPGLRPPLALTLCAALAACAGPRRAAPPPPRTGQPLQVEAQTLGGEPVALAGPGPVRLVEFWATWCGPCAPAAERARRVLAQHPEVLAYSISLDTDRQALARGVAARPPPGQVLVMPGGTSAALRLGVSQLPTFLVVDRDGQVTGAAAGFSDALAARLDQLLREAEGH